MYRRGSIIVRIVAAVLLVALILGGAGLAYRAGFSQGYAQAAILAGREGSQTAPGVPVYPFYRGFWGPGFGFFPFFPLFGFFLFGLFLLFILRVLFRPWRWGYAGHWHEHAHEWGTPPWMREHPEHQAEPKEAPKAGSEGQTGEAGKG